MGIHKYSFFSTFYFLLSTFYFLKMLHPSSSLFFNRTPKNYNSINNEGNINKNMNKNKISHRMLGYVKRNKLLVSLLGVGGVSSVLIDKSTKEGLYRFTTAIGTGKQNDDVLDILFL